jgi:hypothetical protein
MYIINIHSKISQIQCIFNLREDRIHNSKLLKFFGIKIKITEQGSFPCTLSISSLHLGGNQTNCARVT